MTVKTTLTFIALLTANAGVMNASEWLQVKESQFNTENELNYQIVSLYNSQNKKVLQRSVLEGQITIWEYDAEGNVMQEESQYFDAWKLQEWIVNNRKEFTYNPTGQKISETDYMSDWFGNFGINGYTEYIYDENGYLSEETLYSDPNKLSSYEHKEYSDYTPSGKIGKIMIYQTGDGGKHLNGYEVYHYNEDDNLSMLEIYSMNFSTEEIGLNSKTEWSFDESKHPVEAITQSYNMTDDTYANSGRTEYVYDAATGLKTSETTYRWNSQENNWKKMNLTEYAYSDQMDAGKTPRSIEAAQKGGSYEISWQLPAQPTGLSGFKIYLGDTALETLPADQLTYTLSETTKGNNIVYITSIYGEEETNVSDILQLEGLSQEEIEYAMPTFGDITYIREHNYQIDYEMYWLAPETDMEVVGYNVHFNYWPLTEEPVAGTTFSCTLRKMINEVTFGVSAVYADGGESEAHHKDYRIDQLLAGIMQAGTDKEIWSYGGSICVDGTNIRSVEIFDASGMKVHAQVVNNGINLIKLSSNIYIVNAVTDNGTIIKKVFNK